MKTIYLLPLSLLALTACNESARQDALDVQGAQTNIAKDNADIAMHEQSIEQERINKANAKATGNVAEQARSSVAIGAHQVGKAWNEGEKDADQQLLQEHEEDLYQH